MKSTSWKRLKLGRNLYLVLLTVKNKFQPLAWRKMSKNCNFSIFLHFFTITPVSQNNVWVFSRKTGRDRKLKFGMDDPCYMFLKVGNAFVDICFGFWVMLDYFPTLAKNGQFLLVFGLNWNIIQRSSKTKTDIHKCIPNV